jgi:hypothetical protein
MVAYARQTAITAALAVLIAVCVPVFVHRRDFDAAVLAWTRNKTDENAAILNAERRKNRQVVLCVEIVAGCGAFLLLNAGLVLARYSRRRVPDQ